MITVKDFAKQQGCGESIVYRHIRNHKEQLGDRVQKMHGKTWLTDEGADYIRSLMTADPVVVKDRNDEVEKWRSKYENAMEAFTAYIQDVTPQLQEAERNKGLLEQRKEKIETLETKLKDAEKELQAIKNKWWYKLFGGKKE